MLRIYHAPKTRGLRVIWLCEELGTPYEVIPVDFSPTYRASAEWRAINPVGKVPVLEDGDLRMMESGAMVQYVLDRYGDGALQPERGTPEYASHLQWMWFAEATFARPLGEMVNHRREFPGDSAIPGVLAEMAARAELCMAALDAHLVDRTWLLGDTFSAADVMLGYTLLLVDMLIPGRTPDNLAAYWDRLQARPAYQRAIAADAAAG